MSHDDLKQKAIDAILFEAKRGKERSKTMGTSGWLAKIFNS